MERGLRQGDPLSPFLFVLVVDVLHRMIREAMRNGRIYPLLVGRDNIELSHLQFADDTILFCPMKKIGNGRNGIPLVKWEKWDTTSKMRSGDGSKKAGGLGIGDAVLQEVVLPEEITSYSFTGAIWKGFVPPRIELFSWFVLVGWVNTKDRLCRLGVISPNDRTCVLCDKSVESAFHLFAGCEISWQVWCAWLFALGRKWTMTGTLKQHFESWTNAAARRDERRRWVIGFFAVIWTVWLERNDRIFRNQSSRVVDIISRSFLLSDEWSGGEPYGC
ncbi:uncharacterized protein LOC130957269 [Arachis stenosperma]|uniref:uncharacterized protein LOC130957269 n=1 Tax=Arachis stenosperma TaxID=217475 RepID=UPI0025ABFA19|nr:uncharacterized protein LOC130957269 [Arachis stenosperma]